MRKTSHRAHRYRRVQSEVLTQSVGMQLPVTYDPLYIAALYGQSQLVRLLRNITSQHVLLFPAHTATLTLPNLF